PDQQRDGGPAPPTGAELGPEPHDDRRHASILGRPTLAGDIVPAPLLRDRRAGQVFVITASTAGSGHTASVARSRPARFDVYSASSAAATSVLASTPSGG